MKSLQISPHHEVQQKAGTYFHWGNLLKLLALLFVFIMGGSFTSKAQTPIIHFGEDIATGTVCNCLDNATNLVDGQFLDTITVESLPGELWTVVNHLNVYSTASALPPIDPLSLSMGTALEEVSPGKYQLPFIHVDGQTFDIEVGNGTDNLTLGSTCYYPTISFTNIPDEVCETTLGFEIDVDNGGVVGTGVLTVNGVVTNEFNPQTLGVGEHEIRYVFDAGSATAEDANDPGCTMEIVQIIDVLPMPALVVNGSVTVAIGLDCEALITPDMVLEGTYPCMNSDYVVNIIDNQNNSLGNLITSEYVGQTLGVQVTTINGVYLGEGTINVILGVLPTLTAPPSVSNTAVVDYEIFLLQDTIENTDPSFLATNYSCLVPMLSNDMGFFTYHLDTINVTEEDIYTFEGVGEFGPIGGALYEMDFDPTYGPCSNLMVTSSLIPTGQGYYAGQDSVARFSVQLQPDMQYILMTMGYHADEQGAYEWSVFSMDEGGLLGEAIHDTIALELPIYCDAEELIVDNPGSFDWFGTPDDSANCLPLDITFSDQVSQTDECGTITITRTFTGNNGFNQTVQSVQQITIDKLELEDVILPAQTYTVHCDDMVALTEDGHPAPSLTGSPLVVTAFGTKYIDPIYCNIISTYEDLTPIPLCGDNYQFIRRWFVIDNCTSEYFYYNQIIRIGDYTAPVVECINPDENGDSLPDTLVYSATSYGCEASILVPLPEATDNCSDEIDILTQVISLEPVYLTTPFGTVYDTTYQEVVIATIPEDEENRLITGIPQGMHCYRFVATDACGNSSSTDCPFVVRDDIIPTAVCDDDLLVSVGGDGYGRVYAVDVDEGSSDNCGELEGMYVRRLVEYDSDCNAVEEPYFTEWAEYVSYTCCDIGAEMMVQFKVVDISGNENICMTGIMIGDLATPTCVAPPPVNTTCTALPPNFEATDITMLQDVFGVPDGLDNCFNFTITELTPQVNLEDCGSGTILRRFQIEDQYNNVSNNICEQVITITGEQRYSIKFPQDVTVDCMSPNPDTMEFFSYGCEYLTVNVEEDVYQTQDDACFVIFRTYYIRDWCEYTGGENPVVISRDEDCNGEDGDTEVWLIKDNGQAWTDANNDLTDNIPAAGTRGTSCDGQSNPAGRWRQMSSTGFWKYTQVISVMDSGMPTLTVQETQPFCANSTNCTGFVTVPFSADEACSYSNMGVQLFEDQDLNGTYETNITGQALTGGYPNYQLNGQYEIGEHRFRIQLTDGCGNTVAEEVIVEVVDCLAPSPICLDGVAIALSPLPPGTDADSDGDVDAAVGFLSVNQYVSNYGITDCSGNVNFSIYLASDVTNGIVAPAPGHETQVVTCDEIGVQVVRIYAWDGAYNPYVTQPNGSVGGPNYDYCETFAIVQDNGNHCVIPTTTTAMIAGAIYTEEDQPVESVLVDMMMDDPTEMATDDGGSYEINELTTGGDYTVHPMFNDNHSNGVSTFDIIYVTKHILNAQLLDSPYKMIAADVNKSGSISTLDVVKIRKLVLGLIPEFENNTSWRFIPAAYEFPNPANPWEEEFPEEIIVEGLGANVENQDFIAVKVGDVNNSATLVGTTGERSSDRETYFLQVPAQAFNTGQEYRVDFKAGQTEGISGMQFTLNFDRDYLEFLDIEYALASEGNFNLELAERGMVTFSWDMAGEMTVEPGATLFSVVFLSGQSGQIDDLISVSSAVTKAEAYDSEENTWNIALEYVNMEEQGEGFELFQNVPNPFSNRTMIPFKLPVASKAVLTIYDVNGKVWERIEGDYGAGNQQIEVDLSDLPIHGVLYYKLHTSEFAATKKMVLLKD